MPVPAGDEDVEMSAGGASSGAGTAVAPEALDIALRSVPDSSLVEKAVWWTAFSAYTQDKNIIGLKFQDRDDVPTRKTMFMRGYDLMGVLWGTTFKAVLTNNNYVQVVTGQYLPVHIDGADALVAVNVSDVAVQLALRRPDPDAVPYWGGVRGERAVAVTSWIGGGRNCCRAHSGVIASWICGDGNREWRRRRDDRDFASWLTKVYRLFQLK